MENLGNYWNLFPMALKVIYSLTIWITIGIVILENRNPVKTMAWILVLFFLPVIGLLLYLFFGRSKRKERLLNRKGFTRLMKRPLLAYQLQNSETIGQKYPPLISFFCKTSHSFPFTDNGLTLYSDGSSMLLALFKEIGQAKH
ncbi:MAG: PLDc N-terminal domain-containing protein, partial [Phocaeicola sp.]